MRRPSLVFGLVAAATCCALLAGAAPAGAVAVSAWGTAQQLPGLAALSSGTVSRLASVSCASAGNCAAVGDYTDSSGNTRAFVDDEAGGSWGTAQQLPGLAAFYDRAGVYSVSCASAGNCAAGGYYTDSSGKIQAFVDDEAGGSWGTAQQLPGLAALNTGGQAAVVPVSCPSAGNCAAGGSYDVSSGGWRAFVADESGGSWGTAQQVPGLAALNVGGYSTVNSLSCVSAGNCTAVGYYQDSAGLDQAFVVDEVSGSWGTAQEVPDMAALDAGGHSYLASVSCASAGNCAAVGVYLGASDGLQGFVVDEAGGSWGTAQQVPGLAALNIGEHARVYSVSCASAGNCAAGGYYRDAPCCASHQQAFVVDEVGGSWGTAQQVPGSGPLNTGADARVESVSCASAGNCAGGGYYTDSAGHQQAFVVAETNGSWGTAQQVPGSASLNTGGGAGVVSVSCPAAEGCAAGGAYASAASHAFVVGEGWPTSTGGAFPMMTRRSRARMAPASIPGPSPSPWTTCCEGPEAQPRGGSLANAGRSAENQP